MFVTFLGFLGDYAPNRDSCHAGRFARKHGVFGMGDGSIVRTELRDVIINCVVVLRHSTGKEFDGSIVDCLFVCE
jgi:hypothetical protein